MTSSKRCGEDEGSSGTTLPKKLSSWVVASDVCESVDPTMPNLNGFAPSFCSYCRPRLYASRVYSRGSIAGVWTVGPKLLLSQRSKFANSSLGDSAGWGSPSHFILVL